jgi:colanic acid/amylovoran biosynthesis protein
MTKILITNCHAMYILSESNKGCVAVFISTLKILRTFFTDAEFTTFFQLSEDFSKKYGVRIIKNNPFTSKNFSLRTVFKSSLNLGRCALWALLHNFLPKMAKVLVNNKELSEYVNADIIIDASMDLYSDDFGFIAVIEHSKEILFSVLLKKPIVIWAQSLGPFKSRLTSWLVRSTLNRVSLITVREEISLKHLQKLSVNTPPIYVTADPAFLLQPASEERAKEILTIEGINIKHRPLVGVAMSWAVLVTKAKSSIYLQYMKSIYRLIKFLLPERLFNTVLTRAQHFKRLDMSSYLGIETTIQMVDYLVENLDAMVVLIPHDITPSLDDRIVGGEILQKTEYSNRVKLITEDYSAAEIKAVIGQCDLFIGAKMHANIAALSMYVPTVAIQYSHKFHGIMRLLEQEEYICDELNIEQLKAKIDKVWSNREKIRAQLKANMYAIKELSLYNGKLVSELLKNVATQR